DVSKINSDGISKRNRGPIKEVWGEVQGLVQMIADPKVAWKEKSIALAAIIYLVSPVDAIPDIIPIAGLADDFTIIMFAVNQLKDVIVKYIGSKDYQKELEHEKELKIIEEGEKRTISQYQLMTTLVVSSALLILACLVVIAIKA
ncbi:MAG: YkvA family protein, partial [Cyanobacteria bacterium J06592_8]